jgi:hypothetical protein
VESLAFFTSDQGLPTSRAHPKMKTFNETLLGLITQFAASASPPVAIEILNTAASGTIYINYQTTISNDNTIQIALQNPVTLFHIFEVSKIPLSAIRAFISSVHSSGNIAIIL